MAAGGMCEMIPEDLVFQILVWLPVVCVLRFKSVCKSWLFLIDSPRFISQHTHHHLSVLDTADNKLVVLNAQLSIYLYFEFNVIPVSDLQLFKYLEFLPTDELQDNLFNKYMIASFDGLICLKYTSTFDNYEDGMPHEDVVMSYEDVVSLWNPATMQFITLPPGHSDIKKTTHDDIYVLIEYGFGLDVITNDYKVVRVSLECDQDNVELYRSQVEVYSLSMCSWRTIDAVVPLNIYISSNPRKPFQSQVYYWSGWDRILNHFIILSFDFSNEVFGVMPVPDLCSNSYDNSLILSFLMGKIAITCIKRGEEYCEIWVLNEYGVKDSWTKLYRVMLTREYEAMGFFMDEKIILIKRYEGPKLILRDLLTQEDIEVPTQGNIFEAVIYKESLISLRSATGATKKIIYEDVSQKADKLWSLFETGGCE